MTTIKPRVAILGVTGMLGSAVYAVLKDKYDLIVTYKDDAKLQLLYSTYGKSSSVQAIKINWMDLYQDYITGFQGKLFGPQTEKIINQLGSPDWVINAVGITKPHSLKDPTVTFFLNGTLPHILSAAFGEKLIHITTDCVFDGSKEAPYDESSPKRPVDLYGMSKLLGEPTSSLVLRTSIIGPELGDGSGGLLGWFLKQSGQQIKGFNNHLWNGITTKEFGKICDRIISREVVYPGAGIYHIFSNVVTKYEMVTKFKEQFGINVEIEPFAAPIAVDRRLATKLSLNKGLQIPSFDDMLSESVLELVKY